ncbi:hypothetical protein NQZ79_g8680 [Umbelopsis isabellina]|nr:hypothetical protein NQZ79_g8680 [Umbelopsis isabellina]
MAEHNLKGLYAYTEKPKPFFQNLDENPTTWLKTMDRIKRATFTDDRGLLWIVPGYLKGAAEIWWEAVEGDIATWEDIVKQFKSKFSSELLHQKWWDDLESLNQGPSESANMIVIKVQGLIKKLEIQDDDVKVRFLMKALRPESSFEAKRSSPKTWDDAVSAAARGERLLTKCNMPGGSGRRVEGSRISTTSSLGYAQCSHASESRSMSDPARQFDELKMHVVAFQDPKSEAIEPVTRITLKSSGNSRSSNLAQVGLKIT